MVIGVTGSCIITLYVVVWEIVTRREPFENMTLPATSIEVMQGKTIELLAFPSTFPAEIGAPVLGHGCLKTTDFC